MRLRTIAEQWAEFYSAVHVPGVPDVQRQEMRRAFYAGAFAAICTFRDIGDDAVSEDAGVAHMESLCQECRAFQQLAAEGKA